MNKMINKLMMLQNTSIAVLFSAGFLSKLADLPIYFIFGVLFITVAVEADKMKPDKKKIIRYLFGSMAAGWAIASFITAKFPTWMEGEMKIFTIAVSVVFSFTLMVYLLKNDVFGKLLEKYLNNKIKNKDDNNFKTNTDDNNTFNN